jgi:hypothetical protein
LQDRPASIWQKSQQKGRRKIKTEHFIEGAFLIPKNEGDLIMKNTLKLTDGQLEKLFDLVSDALDQEDKKLTNDLPRHRITKTADGIRYDLTGMDSSNLEILFDLKDIIESCF